MPSDAVLVATSTGIFPDALGETFQTCSERSDLNLSAVRIQLNRLVILFTFSSLFSLV